MNEAEHGRRLRDAMARKGLSRTTIADATNRGVRTVTNWTTGRTMPMPEDRAKLRRLMPGYDEDGDAVELAVRQSRLTEDRQYVVIGTYKRHLREQDDEAGRRGA